MTETTFEEQLKRKRNEAGLSQKGLADKVAISKRTIQKWEIGERVPPLYVQNLVLHELDQVRYKNVLEETAEVVEAYLKKAETDEAQNALADILNGIKTALDQ